MNEALRGSIASFAEFPALRVLIVCTGNVCRSPMAEAVMKQLVEERREPISVCSRGLISPEHATVHPRAVTVLRANGLDIDENRPPVRLSFSDVHRADLILVMEQAQRAALRREFPAYTGKVHTLGHWQGVEIKDPLGGDEQQFMDCLSAIRVGVVAWLERIRDMQPVRRTNGRY